MVVSTLRRVLDGRIGAGNGLPRGLRENRGTLAGMPENFRTSPPDGP
jgi:hypothetical protein